jgi:hypothetical protein
MKSFSVTIFDNDYNALIDRVIINAKDRDIMSTWCEEQSWTGESYMIEEELDWVSSKPKLELVPKLEIVNV